MTRSEWTNRWLEGFLQKKLFSLNHLKIEKRPAFLWRHIILKIADKSKLIVYPSFQQLFSFLFNLPFDIVHLVTKKVKCNLIFLIGGQTFFLDYLVICKTKLIPDYLPSGFHRNGKSDRFTFELSAGFIWFISKPKVPKNSSQLYYFRRLKSHKFKRRETFQDRFKSGMPNLPRKVSLKKGNRKVPTRVLVVFVSKND